MFRAQTIRRLVKVCCLDAYCKTGCFPQTGGKQRAYEAIGPIRFTSSSEITNPDHVLFQATRVPVYSAMTLLSGKLVARMKNMIDEVLVTNPRYLTQIEQRAAVFSIRTRMAI